MQYSFKKIMMRVGDNDQIINYKWSLKKVSSISLISC